jgi:hypothetical protein
MHLRLRYGNDQAHNKRERLVVDVSDSTARLLGNGQWGLAHSFALFAKGWEAVDAPSSSEGWS